MITLFFYLYISLIAFTLQGNEPDHLNRIPERTIINLYDAFSKDSNLIKDFGFSCITKYKGMTILFDAGSNADIFKNNVQKLGLDLKQVDIVIISHGHFDHLNGLDYLLKENPKVKIYFPYDIFWGAPVPFDVSGEENGIQDSLPLYMRYFNGEKIKFNIMQSGRFWNANIEFVKSSKEILPGLKLIATYSSYMGYFSCYPNKSFVEGQFEEKAHDCKNSNLPELSLSIKTEKGQVLIVGCSHTGVEQIVESTQKFTNDKIELVMGGFHMIPFNRIQTLSIIDHLKNNYAVNRVAPAHCTGHLAFKLLQEHYNHKYVYAGLGARISY